MTKILSVFVSLVFVLGCCVATEQLTRVWHSGSSIYLQDRSGNNVQTWTWNSNDAVAINAAMSYYGDNGPVEIDPGLYVTTSTVTQSKPMMVSGSGKGATIIDVRHAGVAWQMGTTGSDSIIGDLRDITIQRDTSYRSQNGNTGLYLPRGGYINPNDFHATGWQFGHISDVQSLYSDKNVKIGDSGYGYLVSQPIHFDTCTFGAWDDRCTFSVDDQYAYQLRFTNCNLWGFSGTGSAGLRSVNAGNDVWLDHSYIATTAVRYGYTPGDYGILWENGIVLRVADSQFENAHNANIKVLGCIDLKILGNNLGGFGDTGYGIILQPVNGDVINTRIVGNDITWYSTANSGILAWKNGAGHLLKGITISGNNIDIYGPAGINIWDAYDTSITGNIIKTVGTPNNANGILLGATSPYSGANVVISGNSIDMGGATGTFYGIQTLGTFGWRDIVGNTIYPAGGTAISPAGNTADQIEANNKVS